MQDSVKTLIFLGTGVVLSLVSVAVHFASQPTESDVFELVGTRCYEDFTSGLQAKALEVIALDPESNEVRRFEVALRDGLWRIPSHHDYPAEAAERLAKTATCLVGVERMALVGRRSAEWKRFGVIDPLSDDARDADSTGKRIRLRDADGNILSDLIIGKSAGEVAPESEDALAMDEPSENYYYIRLPDEQQTYKAIIDIDLSTKFSDWVEPDLLKISSGDVRQLKINSYALDERTVLTPQGPVKQIMMRPGEVFDLKRDSDFGDWAMDGLNSENEEVNSQEVNMIVSALDTLQLVGVRPKYKVNGQLVLTSDLKLNKIDAFQNDRAAYEQAVFELQEELDQRGFAIGNDPQTGERTLVSDKGEMSVGTKQGVRYTLHFGDVFLGDETAIEIGGNEQKVEEPSEEGADKSDGGEKAPADLPANPLQEPGPPKKPADESDDSSQKKSRFIMVSVKFDQSLLGDTPVKPVEPTKPAEPEGWQEYLKSKEAKEKSDSPDQTGDAAPAPETSDSAAGNGEDSTSNQEQENASDPANQETNTADEKFVEYEKQLEAYQSAKNQYDFDLMNYENQQEEYDSNVVDGQELAQRLDERFSDWYYVISAGSIESLKPERQALIRPKDKSGDPGNPANQPGSELPPRPSLDFDQAPADDSETDDTSSSDTPKGDPPAAAEAVDDQSGEAGDVDNKNESSPPDEENSPSSDDGDN